MENNNAEVVENVVKDTTNARKYNNSKNKHPHKGNAAIKYQVDEITTNLVKKLKFNADIRHFTALSIVKLLKETLYPADAKLFVTFAWNKFTVSNNGMNTDYPYDKDWVINCIINGINESADNFSEVISEFIREKNLEINKNE